MVTKAEVLASIRSIAKRDGKTPGRKRFADATGITESQWAGRYWRNWSEAVTEAGLEPNEFNTALRSADELVQALADLTIELGRFPTANERRLRHRTDPAFPSSNTFEVRLGNRQQLIRRLVEFAVERPDYETVLDICSSLMTPDVEAALDPPHPFAKPGYVYMIQMDRWHKIGATTDILRRHGEIRLTLPEREHLIHTIETDDPFGVEDYWHRRFTSRRTRGEWFALLAEDVRAFKRWKRIF